MKCTYLINMDDGRLEFRDRYTEKQINLKPVPDEVTEMILRGEVTAKDVINAISMKIKESGEFNITEYLEGLKKLNVRQSNKQTTPEIANLTEVDDAISVAEVKAAAETGDQPVKATKKERVKKVNVALEKAEDNPLEGLMS